ncbi:MAG TPA: outer membrane lipoprotein LolB [Burkholderiaceae bacterium]
MRALVLAGALASLAACSTVPTASPRAAASAPTEVRDNLELSGQIAVHYQHNEQPQHISGTYTWVQRGADVDVTLRSPLGQTVAAIKVTPAQATLQQSGQAPRSAASITQLTTEVLGWPLPVAGLRDWLQGRATDAQGKPYVATPAAPNVTTADGWRITWVWSDGALRRLDLAHDMPGQEAPLTLRITIVEAG